VAVIVAVGAALLGRELVNSDGSSDDRSTSPRKPPGFVEFRAPRTGFRIAYPERWSLIRSRDAEVEFLAAGRGGASALVRVSPFDFQGLPAAKRITDRIVRSGRGVRVLTPARETRLGGLPGFLYIYAFRDAATRRRGAHAHYFLFRGSRMITLVFQALPANRFARLAPLFDRIARTFRA